MLLRLLKLVLGPRIGADPQLAVADQPTQREQVLSEALRLHRSGEHAELVSHCRRYLARRSGDPEVLKFLSIGLLALGNHDDGLAELRRCVAECSSSDGDALLTAARLFLRIGRVDEALDAYRQALAAGLTGIDIRTELAGLLNRLGLYDEAEGYARAEPHTASLRRELARALFEQGRVDTAIAELRGSVDTGTATAALHSEFLRMLVYTETVTPEECCRAHRLWDTRHAAALGASVHPHANVPAPQRRLRVGFVSPHFRKHAVTFFFDSVAGEFDADQVEIVLYSDAAQADEYSDRLRQKVSIWRDTVNLSDESFASLVRADSVDILIDLTGHTPGNRLLAFARRPAPIQMTWNGYPATTGMGAVDYFITDPYCAPPGMTEHLHAEALLRLAEVFMSWRIPADAPAVTGLPLLRKGSVTFASFNACYKLTSTTLTLWARLLAQSPHARLLLAAVPEGTARERIRRVFADQGIDTERLRFESRTDHDGFLRLHANADIALDPFPYHGTTTTCFSLWMGVPVITLAGHHHAARVGVTLLTHAGLPELIASTADDYVDIASRLAADAERLATIRAGLRQGMQDSVLTSGRACAVALQQAWHEAWHRWCEQHGQGSAPKS